MSDQTTAAGWYDDGQGAVRWWDGQQWTEHTQPAAGAQKTPSRTSAIAQRVVTTTAPVEDGVLWSATGKPLKGFGGGRYRLTDEYLFFESGTLSLKAEQIRTHEIHDVDASQTMTQKARGVGSITLIAHRASGRERVLLEDIAEFREGVARINQTAHDARERLRLREHTQHVNYSGTPVQAAPAAVAAAPAPVDMNAELGKLAAFHQQGILTDEEFAAGKRKLLGL
jgi:hypothetical protein